MKLTTQQQKVVDAKIGNLLISAAAGSGKTSVMTERIASRIISGDLALNRVLVMTFTNAAASNMRDKIEKKLAQALSTEEDPQMRARISEQIAYLPLSHISTIHSFCLDVIQNFGYDARTPDGEAVIEPGFSTLDNMRRKLLLAESVDEVLSALYELSHHADIGCDPDAGRRVPQDRQRNSDTIVPFTLLDEEITRAQWFCDFDRMVSSLGNARSDAPIRELLIGRHSYLRSLPSYEAWVIEKLQQMKESTTSFGTTHNAQTLMSDFFEALQLAAPHLSDLQRLLPDVQFVKDKKVNQQYREYYEDLFRVFGDMLAENAANRLTWDRCVQYARLLPEGKGSSRKKEDPDAVRREFFELLPAVYEAMYYLSGKGASKEMMESFRTPVRHLFARTQEELQEDLLYMLPVASRLYEVFFLIDDRYAKKKREENAVDFSDYEHLALLLLSRPDAKKYYSETFDEIYIDEYQDNSRIEDAIVSCFSQNNCFVVGDVKQSIYRFRHARPQLFMDRMHAYRSQIDGELLELNSNFRSRPGILHLVNHIFSEILSESSGEIEYDAGQKLIPEREADSARIDSACVELVLVDVTKTADAQTTDPHASQTEEQEDFSSEEQDDFSSEEPEEFSSKAYGDGRTEFGSSAEDAVHVEDLGKIETSALVIVSKIRELLASERIELGDVAVLTRTNKEAAAFRDQLIRYGIPAEGVGESVFLSSRELLLMESLMKILDNFRQDIPLAAVMRASFPKARFSDRELLEIKLQDMKRQDMKRQDMKRQDIQRLQIKLQESKLLPEAPDSHSEHFHESDYFHEAVLRYREEGPDACLRAKIQQFCDWIDSLRSRSMYLRVSELIEQIYVETGIREQIGSLPDGPKRIMDLETFRDWANRYENSRNGGLYRFVKYIEDIREKGESPDDFDPDAKERDVVHCLSIHKSKGLEFKYVFIGGLDRGFPRTASSSKTLLSENFGMGIDYVRPDEGYYYPTHSKLAMETDEQRAELAEFMRLFYVAMTRAEERLYLIGCVARNKDGSIGKSAELLRLAQKETGDKLPAWLVRKAKSFLDLCILGLARHTEIPLHLLLLDCESAPDTADAVPSARPSPGIRFAIVTANDLNTSITPISGIEADVSVPESPSSPGSDISELSTEELRLFTLQMRGEYPYQEKTRLPSKMSVSELKRRVNDYGRAEDDDEKIIPENVPENVPEITSEIVPEIAQSSIGRRPVNLVVQPIYTSQPKGSRTLSAAEKGTLLHSVFQYLDFASLPAPLAPDSIRQAVMQLVRHHMIRPEHAAEIETYHPAIARFASSALCARMISAEKEKERGPFREIPFSIAVPSGTTDISLVQGMIDIWFIENGKAILVDYKSDRIEGSIEEKGRILRERYAVQLDYYAKAIEDASRLPVTERIIWLIPDGLSFLLEAP